MLTLQEVQDVLPTGQKNVINQDLVDKLNRMSDDPDMARDIRKNFVTYAQVLSEGKFKLGDYLRAIMYVSYKMMDKSNLEAYKLTFPKRYQRMKDVKKSSKDISAYVSSYNSGKLVNLIYERALLPAWLANQDAYQLAVNTLVKLIHDKESKPHIKLGASDSLLNHLKRPEVANSSPVLPIGPNKEMVLMEQTLTKLAETQKKAIEAGQMTVKEIAAMKIINSPETIEGEAVEING